jgi:hypothetical protein
LCNDRPLTAVQTCWKSGVRMLGHPRQKVSWFFFLVVFIWIIKYSISTDTRMNGDRSWSGIGKVWQGQVYSRKRHEAKTSCKKSDSCRSRRHNTFNENVLPFGTTDCGMLDKGLAKTALQAFKLSRVAYATVGVLLENPATEEGEDGR